MINFYKEGEIGKAAFADGSIYTPQGNVSLNYDATTNGIIISEDEKQLYWVKADSELQVEGATITGTGAEKLALIAPVFQGAADGTGDGTGGTSARFGYPGEDVTNDANRSVNMGDKSLSITNLNYADIKAGSSSAFGLLNANKFGAKMQNSRAGEGDVSVVVDASEKQLAIQVTDFAPTGPTSLSNVGIYVQPKWVENYNDGDQFLTRFTGTINDAGATAECDIRVPAVPGIHYLPIIPMQQFANNAAAVAALGVGKLYQSTSTINGSPYILITV